MNANGDPKSNIVAFKAKRQGNLEPVRKGYNACKHERVTVDEATRSVACRDCKVKLDAFTVLYEMAWKQRHWLEELDQWDAYRQSQLSERYDLEWEQTHEGVTSPPTDPEILKVWNIFQKYFKKGEFCGMHHRKTRKRNGPEWYGRSTYGACVSYEYARSQLIPKGVKAQ